jgi:hypothetical protein
MLHYHGTPLGGTRDEAARFLAGRHALVPWPRSEDIGAVAAYCQSFCLDNGAFSAWQSGKPIESWRPYYAWVREWCQHPGFDFAVIPDVIDGTEADNDRLVVECARIMPHWVQMSPVWHMHESLDRLHQMVNTNKAKRVCIGSSADIGQPSPHNQKFTKRMEEAMAVACDSEGRPICKLHGLRMLNPEVFKMYPLASADSTNAAQNYGRYKAPTQSQQRAVIADPIERINSAAVWIPANEEQEQFQLTG